MNLPSLVQKTEQPKEGKERKAKDRFSDINDPDLKRELASGQTRLISYTES